MKLKSILCTVFIFTTCCSIGLSQPVDFNVDPWHSSVQFKVPFWAVTDVSGRFDRFFGTIRYDEKNISNWFVDFTIDATSINTGRDRRDNDLRKNYFNVGLHPGITFRSESFRKNNDGFVSVGTLTLRGTSKEIEIPFKLIEYVKKDDSNPRDEMGWAVGPVSIKRSDFNMHQGLPVVKDDRIFVGDNVELNFLLRLIETNKAFNSKYPEITMTPDELSNFAGHYESEDKKDKFDVKLFGDKLAIQLIEDKIKEEGDFVKMTPIGASKFRNRYRAFAEFKVDNGKQMLIYQKRDKSEQILTKISEKKNIATILLETIGEKNVKAAIKQYKDLKENHADKYIFSETELNTVGYNLLLNQRRTREAVEIFKLYVNEYPDSANAYDSLGEAYMIAGDKKRASENYKKSLQLNPENKNAKKRLKKLATK